MFPGLNTVDPVGQGCAKLFTTIAMVLKIFAWSNHNTMDDPIGHFLQVTK